MFRFGSGAAVDRLGADGGGRSGDGEIDEAFLAIEAGDVEGDAHAHGDDHAIGGDPCAAVGLEAPAAERELSGLERVAARRI